MDAVYLVAGKIALFLVLWFLIGWALMLTYYFMYARHNGCWACGHGDIQDPIARWVAHGGSFIRWEYPLEHQWRVPVAMPLLFWVGLVTFARQVARDRKKSEPTAHVAA